MTRESKLALILSFVLILVVGVLVSDHFSQTSNQRADELALDRIAIGTPLPEYESSPTRIGGSMLESMADSIKQLRAPELAGRAPEEREEAQPRVVADPSRLPPAVISNVPAPSPTRSAAGTNVSGAKTYRVQENDSLYSIARSELGDGERWREIQALNRSALGDSTTVHEGMTLTLPGDARVRRPVSAQARPVAAAESGALRTHKIVSGDTLGEISQRYLGTIKRMDEILELNGLDDPDSIRLGMTLKIPAR